jgi:excisionase family DNA binding protein
MKVCVVTQSKPIPEKCLSVREVADYVGCSVPTIKRLIYAKKLGAFKVGSRVVISPEEFERYRNANPAVPR